MKYADFYVSGDRYRAVKFTSYRPGYASATYDLHVEYQKKNGYETNKTYYFKYEPLIWRVLDPDENLVICNSIIDTQSYQDWVRASGTLRYAGSSGYYANNYRESSIRPWLNKDFYNTAFTELQKKNIRDTDLDNSAFSALYPEYNSLSTTDKIFLLSYSDTYNESYGFGIFAKKRLAKGTDYAKCQGLYVETDGFSGWWLRSAGPQSDKACCIDPYGSTENFTVDKTYYGVRPVCRLSDLSAYIQYTVTASASPPEGGTVTGGGKYSTGETVTLKAAKNAGWSFYGWLQGDTVKSINSTYSFTVTGDVTLTAKFTKAPITVTLDANGGSVSPTTWIVSIGEKYGQLPTPTRDGYTFLGWFDGTTKITASTTVTRSSTHTLTAHWEQTPIPPTFELMPDVWSGKVDYRSTILFQPKLDTIPAGAEVHWIVNGEEVAVGSSYKADQVKKDFSIQAKLMQGSTQKSASEVKTVKVDSSFFARLKAFFRSLFHKLPVITQEYLGIEIYE